MPEKAPTTVRDAVPPPSKKRKQSPPTTTTTTASSPQPTIPTLFKSDIHPTPKRPRSKPSTPPASSTTPVLTQATMLNFPTTTATPTPTPTIIDLTASPPPPSSTLTPTPRPRPPPFQPHAGARKLQIKNLRKPTRGDPDAYFTATWGALDAALGAIFASVKIAASLEELYRGVENICRAERGQQLAERLRRRMDVHVGGKLKAEVEVGLDGGEVVREVERAWRKWNEQLVSFCLYMCVWADGAGGRFCLLMRLLHRA